MRLCLRCGAEFAPVALTPSPSPAHGGRGEFSSADEAGEASADWRCPQCGYAPPSVGGFPSFAPELARANSGFDAAQFAEYAGLESSSFWFRARNRLIQWALARHFPAAMNFLEVGCGTGFVLSGIATAFPALAVTGSEVAAEGLGFAARRAPRATLIQMDARRIPFRAEFDVAGAFDVIEHIEDDRAVLAELYESVVPGGGLLLTVPQHPSLWSEYDVRAHHVRRYRRRELREKMIAAGFEIVTMTSFVTLLLPLMYLSRLSQRAPKADYDPFAEFRIAAWLNQLLEKVLHAERALIKSGINLPAGGSLLAVARRPR